jgi:hypothetical protein
LEDRVRGVEKVKMCNAYNACCKALARFLSGTSKVDRNLNIFKKLILKSYEDSAHSIKDIIK